MALWFAWIASMLLAVIGLVHVYWVGGGRLGIGYAIPTKNGKPLFKPGKIGTVMVALLAWLGGFLLLVQAGAVKVPIPAWIPTWTCWAMAIALLIRVVGDFRFVGIAKTYKSTTFATYDTRFYVPLCFVMAGLVVGVMLAT